ncbi:Txe/YoeB family addiction module toxin [Myroides sp.]|uniref:Txe/YoeB family addiction module toxin n=1 Tax=Myroides sp. TaxID=1874736 RepID=UPI003F3E5965
MADIYRSGHKKDIKRIEQIFSELAIHPEKGIGHPEQLKYELSGFWSRRINTKDRLIYKIDKNKVIVTILSVKGHYLDK